MLDASTRGTNTSIKFDFTGLSISVTEITDCIMTVKQGRSVTEYQMDSLAFDPANETISYVFSQTETLAFKAGTPITFELHFIVNGLRYKSRKTIVNVDDTDLNREIDVDDPPTPPTPVIDWEALYKGMIDRSAAHVYFPEGITKIGIYAFYACQNMGDIIIPEGVTEIGQGAFFMCAGAEVVDIPETVTKIDQSAFATYGTLREVHVRPTTPPTLQNSVFGGSSTTIQTMYVYAPLSVYMADSKWATILAQAQNVIEVV